MRENNWIRYERPGDRQPQFVYQHEETGRLVVAPQPPSERWHLVRLPRDVVRPMRRKDKQQ